jgi:hypothetical protein
VSEGKTEIIVPADFAATRRHHESAIPAAKCSG